MPKEHISLPRARPMPFSSVVKAGNFVYTSGHTGSRDPEGNPLTTIEDQTRQTMINLKKTLDAAGVSFDDAVKATIFLKRMEDFGEMNGVYRSFYDDNLPARSTLVTNLVAESILVEIELVLYKE
ncbi:RidA family protein [Candidatus Bathyarchaeota archaeon]|nr:RidA family protein [Candidatus Bathyarchaeota archaeon]MBT5642271.1 RidA family protein [Candidatus Bathyarchaeota archaeon]MBT7186208.1 RidA family protein [Candidatus Bathyarchaeota archaeon]MBT7345700.1 RidA family protein [Candidatus Bathyarchaeota archaeon]